MAGSLIFSSSYANRETHINGAPATASAPAQVKNLGTASAPAPALRTGALNHIRSAGGSSVSPRGGGGDLPPTSNQMTSEIDPDPKRFPIEKLG